MRPGKRVACILEHIFIKLFVFILFDLLFVANPKRFVFINSFKFHSLNVSCGCSIHWILNLIFVKFFSLSRPLFSYFLDLCFYLGLGLLNLLFCHHNFLEINWIIDKITVSFDESPKFIMLAVFRGIFFQVQSNDGSSLQLHSIISLNCKDVRSWRYPLVLNIIIMFGNDFHLWSYKEGGIETNTELPNEVEFSSLKIL